MNLFYFVSISVCVSLSIDFVRSQLHGLSGFQQSKAIRDNAGYFRTETFFPGSSGNAIHQNPILPPTTRLNPGAIPLAQHPIVVNTPEEHVVDSTVVRSAQNRLRNDETISSVQQTTTTFRPMSTTEPETSEELQEQAKSANYKFGTSVHDTINDHEHVREEVREGLALKGMYSYSDGFFRRQVFYQADADGYRVIKEEIQPIGDGKGPKFNPKGQADVKSTLSGDYAITVDDFRLNKKQEQQISLI